MISLYAKCNRRWTRTQSLDNNLLKRFVEKVGKESSKRTNKKRDAGMNIQMCLLESQQTGLDSWLQPFDTIPLCWAVYAPSGRSAGTIVNSSFGPRYPSLMASLKLNTFTNSSRFLNDGFKRSRGLPFNLYTACSPDCLERSLSFSKHLTFVTQVMMVNYAFLALLPDLWGYRSSALKGK